MKRHPIIQQLREIRINKKISQHELAYRTGYHVEAIGKWERGLRPPRWYSLNDWCAALDCELVVRPK